MLDRAYVDGSLATVALATAAYYLGRLVAAPMRDRRIEHDVEVTHVVMGVGMAGMLVSKLDFVDAAVWKAVFTALAAWYAARIVFNSLGRRGSSHRVQHYSGHLLSTGAMLYMYFAPVAAPDGMNMAMAGAGANTHAVTLAPLLATVLFGYAILVIGRIPSVAAMNLTMGIILITML
jgi:uncharacterized protein DUF5134